MGNKKSESRDAINRREAMAAIFTGIYGLKNVSVLKTVKKQSSQSQPNIIWLISDDASKVDHGCYGNPVRTVNIDRLAEEGVRFSSAFATASSCSPSRVTMFTGKYPHSIGAEDLHAPLPVGQSILPSMLRQKDYISVNCGKLHLGANGEKQFDKIYKGANDWKIFSQEMPKDKPFFLSIGFREAHRKFRKNLIENPHSPEGVIVPPYLADIHEVREELALYYDEISFMDAEIGRLLAWLDKEGLAENTLVIYFSDQGMPFPRAKTSVYDSGIGVPLIARWKGRIPEGIVQSGLASLLDLAPTMLEIADITPGMDIQGRSMSKMFFDAGVGGREYVFAERNWHDVDDHIRCVRTDRHKYIRNYYPDEVFGHPADIVNSISYQGMLRLLDEGKLSKQQMLIFCAPRSQEELYDLRTDPNEFENLVYRPEYQDVLKKMSLILDRLIRETNDVSPEKRMINGINIRSGEWVAKKGPQPRK
ncbi:sulfatase [candidate division KSB1 bacterium]